MVTYQTSNKLNDKIFGSLFPSEEQIIAAFLLQYKSIILYSFLPFPSKIPTPICKSIYAVRNLLRTPHVRTSARQSTQSVKENTIKYLQFSIESLAITSSQRTITTISNLITTTTFKYPSTFNSLKSIK